MNRFRGLGLGLGSMLLVAAGCGENATGVDLGLFADLAATGRDAATATDASRVADAAADASTTAAMTIQVGPNNTFTFSPATATIRIGDTVRWVWATSGHTVTSGTNCVPDNQFCAPNNTGCASNPIMNAGATYQHTFLSAGTFNYFCRPHCPAGMVGSITVQ